MNIPVDSPLGYLGVFFLVAGFFLILSGINVLKIQQVSIVPGKKTWIVGIIVVLCGFLALFLDISGVGDSENLKTATPSGEQSTAFSTDASVLVTTPTPNSVAAKTSGENILAEAKSWPLILNDPFTLDKGIWPLTAFEGHDEDVVFNITGDGKYRWDMTSNIEGPYHIAMPSLDPVSNFYLSVEVKLVGGDAALARYGLIFRANGNNFYVFRIEEGSMYRVRYHLDDWTDLTGQMMTSIKPLSNNKLTVITMGDRLLFYINDRLVEDLQDTTAARGNVGIILTVDGPAGTSASIEFDNFELRQMP